MEARHHPDRVHNAQRRRKAEAKFKEVADAWVSPSTSRKSSQTHGPRYTLLSDPLRRKEYDTGISEPELTMDDLTGW
jgi:curved DNA-binding protein CbpA